jgi:integrase/recombinase XerD
VDEHIAKFLDFMMVERHASLNTKVAYRNDLLQLEAFLVQTEVLTIRSRNWGDVPTQALLDYLESLKETRALATIARRQAAIRSFYSYLIAEGIIRHDPSELLPALIVRRHPPRTLSYQEVRHLINSVEGNAPEVMRDRAMLELLYATGLRVTELVSINIEDLCLDERQVVVRHSSYGSEKERVVPFHALAQDAVQDYFEEARPIFIKARRQPALFVNRRGERLTRQGFWLILKQYAEKAAVEGVTPHTLRHSFAKHLLEGGASLGMVQQLLGHRNISTTQVYNLVTDGSPKLNETAHPRAALAVQ